ncbi:small ribosomal subunit protein mS40 [Anabrus simplex]|uniref:small ribosomal subunit protein mS40 n=1 Tax=Anabrus simplex TaxID=316456 RepID=UPI0034DCF8E6
MSLLLSLRNLLFPNTLTSANPNVLAKNKNFQSRFLNLGSLLSQEKGKEEEGDKVVRDPSKDRTKIIPLETSLRYLASDAYRETYGNEPVWVKYRRNHKGMFPPKKTRKTCIRHGMISSGNPCPICRDEYLVLDYRNEELLKQFISPYTGEVLSYSKTGLCQKRHLELLVAVEKAKDYGFLTFHVPFRVYDYSEYYKV